MSNNSYEYIDKYPNWLSKCQDIYLDLGSNIGVKVQKLFEPHKFPLHKAKDKKSLQIVLDLYDSAYGPLSSRTSHDLGLCALGFEPNTKHHRRLKDLSERYLQNGWNVHFSN